MINWNHLKHYCIPRYDCTGVTECSIRWEAGSYISSVARTSVRAFFEYE